MLVTAIHKRLNISSLEQGTTRHASEYDMRYSISIRQPPPAVIITHYQMSLIEVVRCLCRTDIVHDPLKGQSNTEKRENQSSLRANYLNFRAAGQGPGAAWRSAPLFRIVGIIMYNFATLA